MEEALEAGRKKCITDFTTSHKDSELVSLKRSHNLKIARLKKVQNEDFICS